MSRHSALSRVQCAPTRSRVSLEGRGAIVTGGGRGIGAACARALAERGAAVVVSARSRGEIDAVASALVADGHRAFAVPCDVGDAESVQGLSRVAAERLGTVDVLVNNAGVASSAPLKALELVEWERIFRINSTGTFLCTQAFVPGMVERRWGRVVNVASVASRVGTPYISAYTASKHAVLGFTRSVASEVKSKGVTINCVCPGYVDTDMTVKSVSNVVARTKLSEEEALAAILQTVGQVRLVTPDEVAFLVASLCEPLAGSTTGQAIVMDAGGLLA